MKVAAEEEDVERMIDLLDKRILQAIDSDPHMRMSEQVEAYTRPDREMKGRLESSLDRARDNDSPR